MPTPNKSIKPRQLITDAEAEDLDNAYLSSGEILEKKRPTSKMSEKQTEKLDNMLMETHSKEGVEWEKRFKERHKKKPTSTDEIRKIYKDKYGDS